MFTLFSSFFFALQSKKRFASEVRRLRAAAAAVAIAGQVQGHTTTGAINTQGHYPLHHQHHHGQLGATSSHSAVSTSSHSQHQHTAATVSASAPATSSS